MAFNASFEKKILTSCVDAYPEHRRWLTGIDARLKDLRQPFKNFDIYHPCQHGTASMKAVLPALTGKSYKDLEIQDGGQASNEFMRVTFGKSTDAERQDVRLNLEEYCGQDTMGMLDIIRN